MILINDFNFLSDVIDIFGTLISNQCAGDERAFIQFNQGIIIGQFFLEPRIEGCVMNVEGKDFSTASLKGKVILIDFWATWCGPCRQEMPMLSRVATQYTGKGIKTVGIALDQPEQLLDFLRDLRLHDEAVGVVLAELADTRQPGQDA